MVQVFLKGIKMLNNLTTKLTQIFSAKVALVVFILGVLNLIFTNQIYPQSKLPDSTTSTVKVGLALSGGAYGIAHIGAIIGAPLSYSPVSNFSVIFWPTLIVGEEKSEFGSKQLQSKLDLWMRFYF